MKSKNPEQRRRLDKKGKEALRVIADRLAAHAAENTCLAPQQAGEDAGTLRRLVGPAPRNLLAEAMTRSCAIRRKMEPKRKVADIYGAVAEVYGVELQTVHNYNTKKRREQAQRWLERSIRDDAAALPENEKLGLLLTDTDPPL